jgi:CRISPR system Cascade subunit CasA
LAILHRVFGPSDWRAWREISEKGHFNEPPVKQYLEGWRARFDLFDEKRPFYQTSTVSLDYAKSTAKLAHELASGQNKTLFDHTMKETPPVLSPAEATQFVVAHQAYAVGGTITREIGEGTSADSAFLVKGAALLAIGRNLFETLMLNLVHYNPDDEEPFAFDAEKDMPAWEREEDVKPNDRLPDGYLDWLTWQSRRIRLKPEVDDQGRLVVREAVIMKGCQLPDNQWRYGRETMIAFRKVKKATGKQEPWMALAYREDKALWRDMLSLLQSVDNESARPKTVEWLADLKDRDALPEGWTRRLSAYGLCSERADIDFWRHEILPLPLEYLSNQELVSALKSALTLAEEAGKRLRESTWRLVCDELSPGRLYWSRLETPFKRLLEDLPNDESTDEYGSTVYGEHCLPEWAETIRRAALEAFNVASAAIGESARALKARARAESVFRERLNDGLRPYYGHRNEGGEES